MFVSAYGCISPTFFRGCVDYEVSRKHTAFHASGNLKRKYNTECNSETKVQSPKIRFWKMKMKRLVLKACYEYSIKLGKFCLMEHLTATACLNFCIFVLIQKVSCISNLYELCQSCSVHMWFTVFAFNIHGTWGHIHQSESVF